MRWLKDSIIDLAFLGVILSTLFYPSDTTLIIIWAYTGLLGISKVLAVFMPALQKRAAKTDTPNWIYHIIYAASLGTFLYANKWYLAVVWAIIWLLSIIILAKQTKNVKS